MNPEFLPSHESKPDEVPVGLPQIPVAFTEEWVTETYKERLTLLESFKATISLKAYYAITEKLKREQEECLKLLNSNQEEAANLSRYTFVLDPAYFEQLFLN